MIVNIILHELLGAAELNMLVHELRHIFLIIHELHQVLLHDGVLIGGCLKTGLLTHPIPTHTFVINDLIDTLTMRKLLEERL